MIQTEIQEYDKNTKWDIGQRIQKKRLEKGIPAMELAAYFNIKANQISKIENGRANCTVPELFVLAQLLDCSVDYLLFGKEPETKCSPEQEKLIKDLYRSIA